MFHDASLFELHQPIFIDNSCSIKIDMRDTSRHPSTTSYRYSNAVSQDVQMGVDQLIQAGVLRPTRPIVQCSGNWKPRMDLIDDPSSPNLIAIFELPGVKHENITLQIKDGRLLVSGNRADPFTEVLATVKYPPVEMSAPTNPAGSSANLAPQLSIDNVKIDEGGSVTPDMSTITDNSTRELRYGSFFRSIPLPEGIKQSEISTGTQDGMLIVTLPRVPTTACSPTSEVGSTSSVTNTTIDAVNFASVAHPSVPTEASPVLWCTDDLTV